MVVSFRQSVPICVICGQCPEAWSTDGDADAAVMARLKYLRVPAPLPAAGDVAAQAKYWSDHCNTKLGKGAVASYVETWTRYTA